MYLEKPKYLIIWNGGSRSKESSGSKFFCTQFLCREVTWCLKVQEDYKNDNSLLFEFVLKEFEVSIVKEFGAVAGQSY